jgi:localization factor PodJL
MGVLLLMPRGKPKRAAVPNTAIEQPLLPSDTAGEPNAVQPDGTAAPAAPQQKGTSDAAGEDLGFDTAPAVPQQNMMLEPEGSDDPNMQSMSLQAPGSAPLSLDLIKLDVPEANESATPSEASPVAASLRLESQSASSEPVTQVREANAPLDLPPATVGPLSLRLAAAKGDPSAEFEVGARLAEGKGTKQDFKEAIRWYQRSATRGFAQSQYRLATLFERGLGTKPDLARARIWYQRAAEQGNVKAMHNLAVLSAGRESGNPDYMTAAKWFESAALHGLADSQFNLAVLTEAGLGVAKDQKRAFKWFSLAARSGDGEAVRRRDGLKAQMSPADLAEAEALASTFSPKPAVPLINDARVAGEDWKKRQSPESSG